MEILEMLNACGYHSVRRVPEKEVEKDLGEYARSCYVLAPWRIKTEDDAEINETFYSPMPDCEVKDMAKNDTPFIDF